MTRLKVKCRIFENTYVQTAEARSVHETPELVAEDGAMQQTTLRCRTSQPSGGGEGWGGQSVGS